MCVSVEYFDDEPREPLCLALPKPKLASRAGSVAHELVQEAKRKAAQEQLDNERLEDEDWSNTLQFKYLGVKQSGEGDPLTPVKKRITKSWNSFRNLKRVLTDTKLPTSLRLRLFLISVVSSLFYGCKSWKLTDKICRKLNSTCSEMISKITGREIEDNARTSSINVLLRTRDIRWN